MPKNSYKGNRNIKKNSTKARNSRGNSKSKRTSKNTYGDFTKDLIGDMNTMPLNQMANFAQNPYANPMLNPYIDPAMNSMGQNIDPSSVDPLHLNYMIPMDSNYSNNNINNYGVNYDQLNSGNQNPMISNMNAPI